LTALSGTAAVFSGCIEIAGMVLRLNYSGVTFRRVALKSTQIIKPENMSYTMHRQEITGCYTARCRLAVVIDGGYI
jgi:hypothetical protein